MVMASCQALWMLDAHSVLLYMTSMTATQGQETIAMEALERARQQGGWVLLQNIHLTIDWTAGPLEKCVDKLAEGAHPDFRCAADLRCT